MIGEWRGPNRSPSARRQPVTMNPLPSRRSLLETEPRLDIGAKHFAANAYEFVPIADIAADEGVSRGLVYRCLDENFATCACGTMTRSQGHKT